MRNLNKIFITFEGIDGCGKTTQAMRLKKWLEDTGHDVLYTFEPGDWSGGENIRKMLLNGEIKDELARLILFLGDRKFHVESVIKPALEAGKIVICDRYIYSTIAYQSAALGYDFVVKSVELYDFLMPDVTFLLKNNDLKIPASRLDARNKAENKARDFIESGGALNKIADIYDKILKDNKNKDNDLKDLKDLKNEKGDFNINKNKNKNRIELINADGDEKTIETKIRSVVEGLLA